VHVTNNLVKKGFRLVWKGLDRKSEDILKAWNVKVFKTEAALDRQTDRFKNNTFKYSAQQMIS